MVLFLVMNAFCTYFISSHHGSDEKEQGSPEEALRHHEMLACLPSMHENKRLGWVLFAQNP